MFYHNRPMKYVVYDKVIPPPLSEYEEENLLRAYKWLSLYCGYYPQIWLSRSKSCITGYKNARKFPKKREFVINKSKDTDYVMFGFENIIGFPVDFKTWEMLLGALMGCKDPIKNGNKEIASYMNEALRWSEEEKIEVSLQEEREIFLWKQCNYNIDKFLKDALFKENDQVVVPALNLKSAKVIYCRDEHQVKKLRRMGFINDRIKILNSKCWDF